MPDLKLNPSTMLAKALLVFAVILAIAAFVLLRDQEKTYRIVALIIPLILAANAVRKMVIAQYTRLEMVGDRLKFETGMASRSTRSIPLAKVQDVTVKQSMSQRILGLGDLVIETAGEAGRITVQEIAAPRVVAEQILDRVAELGSQGGKSSSKGRS